jgi:hypothetical protein
MSCFFRSFPPVVHFELDSTNGNLFVSDPLEDAVGEREG